MVSSIKSHVDGFGLQASEDTRLKPEHDGHLWLADFLKSKMIDGFVDRAAIQPEDILPALLPCLIVLDRLPADGGARADFVYRLMGGTLVDYAGVNMTGKLLSNFPHPDIRASMETYAHAVCDHIKPLFSVTHATFGLSDTVFTERSIYPTTKGDTTGIIALITVNAPPAPYDSVKESPNYRHVREHYRLLDGVGCWG